MPDKKRRHEARGNTVWRINGPYVDAPDECPRGDYPILTVNDGIEDPENMANHIAMKLDAK